MTLVIDSWQKQFIVLCVVKNPLKDGPFRKGWHGLEGIIKDHILQSGLGDKMVEYVNTGILLVVFGYLMKLSGRISKIEGYLDLKINKKKTLN